MGNDMFRLRRVETAHKKLTEIEKKKTSGCSEKGNRVYEWKHVL